jgi:zinc/manganese transport system substrate-binding protein
MRISATLRNLAIGLFALLLAPTLRAAPVEVVATFSILGDLVRQVGGEHVRVVTLVGPDADTHNYQARPSDARLIGNARLVVANGMGFDAWIDRLVKSAGYSGQLLRASDGATAIGGKDDHDHKHGAADPHMWQSIVHVEHYVRNIAGALARVDPGRRPGRRCDC